MAYEAVDEGSNPSGRSITYLPPVMDKVYNWFRRMGDCDNFELINKNTLVFEIKNTSYANSPEVKKQLKFLLNLYSDEFGINIITEPLIQISVHMLKAKPVSKHNSNEFVVSIKFTMYPD